MSRGALSLATACGACLIFLVVGIGEASAPDGSTDLGVVFREANALYEKGEYADAIEKYSGLVHAGVLDKDLFYNLANAYYKNDDLGRAVLYYEKALRLSPRDGDTRENLALVRSQLKDRQFVRSENRLTRVLLWPHKNLSAREIVVVVSCAYVLLCLLLIAVVFRDWPRPTALYRRVSVLSLGRLLGLSHTQDLVLATGIVLFVFLTSGISAWQKIGRDMQKDEAVVLSEEVPVYSSPTGDATLQFKVHEGTVVRIREERSRWVRIELPGGLSGWLSDASIGDI